MDNWRGITYPEFLDNELARWLWKRWGCAREYHLFDEIYSVENGHRLYCDACGLTVYIDRIEKDDE